MTGARTGAGGLESKTVLKIRWKSFSEYLTTEESAEPEAASGATTSVAAGVETHLGAGTEVQRLLPLVGVSPAILFLPS